MVSATLVKLSSPVARSCLVAVGVALLVSEYNVHVNCLRAVLFFYSSFSFIKLTPTNPHQIDAVLTFFAASQYPYLIAYINELYVSDSHYIIVVYSAVGVAAILLTVSTAVASFKAATNYILIHACITGVFLPVSILVYFTSFSSRYKVADYVNDYKQMLTDYRIVTQQIKTISRQPSGFNGESIKQLKLSSFINLIDSIQIKFACCGIESPQDWIKQWHNYLPPSCCKNQATPMANDQWAQLFKMDSSHEFHYCNETEAYHMGCLAALKEDEQSKFAWLGDLIVFLMVMTISNTIISLLLFGLTKTEDMPYDTNEHELAMVGVSAKPRPSQPEITGIRHRPSVVQTLGANKEQIAAISQAVRFNLSNSPRASISGPSKFSAGARRGSAFV